MNIKDCKWCSWLGYDPLENEEVCMLHDERPVGEIEVCNANIFTDEQETLIIEGNKEK